MSVRAELGIKDGYGFARHHNALDLVAKREMEAAKLAFRALRARLGDNALSYWFGPSHPYGS